MSASPKTVMMIARLMRVPLNCCTQLVELTFDVEQGRIKGITQLQRNDAHRLIEEAMLGANVCAARFIGLHQTPGLYRVHEAPDDEKIAALAELLSSFGISASFSSPVLPAEVDAALRQIATRKRDACSTARSQEFI